MFQIYFLLSVLAQQQATVDTLLLSVWSIDGYWWLMKPVMENIGYCSQSMDILLYSWSNITLTDIIKSIVFSIDNLILQMLILKNNNHGETRSNRLPLVSMQDTELLFFSIIKQ